MMCLQCSLFHLIYSGCNSNCVIFSLFLLTHLLLRTHMCTLPHSCVHYSCEAIDCQEPIIRNAELKCNSLGRHFYNGDRCTISCNSGYVLQVHQDDDIIKSQVQTLPRRQPMGANTVDARMQSVQCSALHRHT